MAGGWLNMLTAALLQDPELLQLLVAAQRITAVQEALQVHTIKILVVSAW
jgi:hypothetical protein